MMMMMTKVCWLSPHGVSLYFIIAQRVHGMQKATGRGNMLEHRLKSMLHRDGVKQAYARC
jgi:hypothetical protein